MGTVFRLWFGCDFPSSYLDGCPNVSMYLYLYLYLFFSCGSTWAILKAGINKNTQPSEDIQQLTSVMLP